ncbi:hypothetical protein OH720_20535 [Pseudomonas sp. WJP1]|uniref:hypothetical protein n=1 Tax=Pseudomonas sp. WJP1 TaxID=2986947 RepID=UPI00234AFA9F|nr:hypothetical protein [Pseudomonas sp. WJP1]WCM54541.1 hypothetical protein OH720_20535 [Pseudomonas sp. WJP1]
MCTLTHFAHPQASYSNIPASLHPAVFLAAEAAPRAPKPPRFHVVLAGNAFFHIKETSTGHVRGFRGDHNQACALARALESRM